MSARIRGVWNQKDFLYGRFWKDQQAMNMGAYFKTMENVFGMFLFELNDNVTRRNILDAVNIAFPSGDLITHVCDARNNPDSSTLRLTTYVKFLEGYMAYDMRLEPNGYHLLFEMIPTLKIL
jgi:hypothetical protein